MRGYVLYEVMSDFYTFALRNCRSLQSDLIAADLRMRPSHSHQYHLRKYRSCCTDDSAPCNSKSRSKSEKVFLHLPCSLMFSPRPNANAFASAFAVASPGKSCDTRKREDTPMPRVRRLVPFFPQATGACLKSHSSLTRSLRLEELDEDPHAKDAGLSADRALFRRCHDAVSTSLAHAEVTARRKDV